MQKIESREQARVAPLTDVVRIVDEFATLQWPVPQADVPALITRLGWTPEEPLSATTLVANTGWTLNRPEVALECDNGQLTTVDFNLTDVIRDDHPWRGEYLNDVFASAVSALIAARGRPDKSTKGAEPSARWELASGGRATVSQIDTIVFVAISSAEWAEVNRRMGA